MGKIRYYCEYCDRSFLDDLQARKKHLSGTQHNRMKHQFYLPFRSAKEIYDTEILKDPCRKYMTLNMCPFGDSCKYSHYSPVDLERLQQQAEMDSSLSFTSTQTSTLRSPEEVNSWLEFWKTKRRDSAPEPVKPAVQAVSKAWACVLPPRLREYSDLPPSLQPWKAFDLQSVHLEDWG